MEYIFLHEYIRNTPSETEEHAEYQLRADKSWWNQRKRIYRPKQNSVEQRMLCYAKSLQSGPTLCDPIDGSPPGSPIPGILQARTLEWVAISFSNA